jgi:1-acyl-sn-glycerol-3-phosphate acyltransferase
MWEVTGMENLPTLAEKANRGIIMVSNHQSLLEPIILIGLFGHWYIFNMKYAPWNIAETGNFKRGLFRLVEGRIIFVDRKSEQSKKDGFSKAKSILKSGGIVIVFPEGGRTSSARPGECLIEGVDKNGNSSENRPKIRHFSRGAALLAIQTQAMVIPVWVNGTDKVSPNMKVARYRFPRFWRRVTIAIGKPMSFPTDMSVEVATHELEKAVLDLANQ